MKNKKTVSILLIIFSIFLVLALATSPIKARTEILTFNFYPTDDTYISGEANATNFGEEGLIKIRNNYGFANSSGWEWDALIGFNISILTNKTIITSATLNLFLFQNNYYNSSNNILSLYRITKPWDENNITWDEQLEYNNLEIINITITNKTNTWIQVNITDEIIDIINNSEEFYGWTIRNNIHWGLWNIPEYIFKSKETNNNEYRPYLEIKLKHDMPQPDFQYNINIINKTVYFTDNSTIPNGSIFSYYWEFGDRNTYTLKNTTHNYSKYGEFKVNLTLEDQYGVKSRVSKTIILNIEEKIKKEIEEYYNITLAENFYANSYKEFIDPNKILSAEQIINIKDISFLISVNNSLDDLFLWNLTDDFIKPVEYIQIKILESIEIKNNAINLNFNTGEEYTNYNYIQIKDYFPNISNITIIRSDESIVAPCFIFRENQQIYIFDKNYSNYQIIYSNATVGSINETIKQENNTTDKQIFYSNVQIAFLLVLIIGSTVIPLLIYSLNKRKKIDNFLEKGNKEIIEIDTFLKEK